MEINSRPSERDLGDRKDENKNFLLTWKEREKAEKKVKFMLHLLFLCMKCRVESVLQSKLAFFILLFSAFANKRATSAVGTERCSFVRSPFLSPSIVHLHLLIVKSDGA